MSRMLTRGVQVRGASAVLHGMHPLRGYPATWHLTPLTSAEHGAADFLVERADGRIDDPLVWELAEKETVVMDTHEVTELARRVSARQPGA